MSLQAGQHVLGERYRLIDSPVASDAKSMSWIGVDAYDTQFLIKLWPYERDQPDELQRALWDAELRTMYRVGSSPGAEDAVLVIRDAGLDRVIRCFVMVMEAQAHHGYTTLASVLPQRGQIGWLSNQDIVARRDLWQGLGRLADGLQLLHDQNVLHGNPGAETVFFNRQVGSSSLRLGGFEWSIRLGHHVKEMPATGWSTPPEILQDQASGYSRASDWYAFGMLATRCLLNIEAHAMATPAVRHSRVVKEVEKATARQLTDIERTLLLRLIDAERGSRPPGYEVRTTVKEIVAALARGGVAGDDARPLVIVIDPRSNQSVRDRATALGFVPNPSQPRDAFNPGDLIHVTNFTTFVQRQLAKAQLYAVWGQNFFVMTGGGFTLMLVPFDFTDQKTNKTVTTWDFAFCTGMGQVRGSGGGQACRDMPEEAIVVRSKRQVYADRQSRQDARNWERYLPPTDRAVELRAALTRFHEFIRCTNQLELLIRDAELFRYEVVPSEDNTPGRERIVICESKRERPPAAFCTIDGGLLEFLQRELDSGKENSDLVLLTERTEDVLTLSRRYPKEEFWEIEDIDPDRKLVLLGRPSMGQPLPPPPLVGTIRTFGMFGQVSLIRRRKRAIDRLGKHSYLLRSLSAPGQVYMDTGEMTLLVPLDPANVDEAKQAVMQDILRVRPIYALQGPPGTGKTTMVSHLVREILADDPVAQILITAQAHGAVDVLRGKVRDEAFRGIIDQPLAVRLGSDRPLNATRPTEGSVEEVSLSVLQQAQQRLTTRADRTPVQEEWLESTGEMIQALEHWTPDRKAPEFCELVKRGASLTYCTTSAGDLEVLAEGVQSFDWSIIEEAGKAHCFDLALPLQAGHRWLLIGDPNQLPPYRIENYKDALDDLDDAVGLLEQLPNRAGGLLDTEWVNSWWDRSPQERSEFKAYAKDWIKTFDHLLKVCQVAVDGTSRRTIAEQNGSMAGMLSRQYRMHPAIGDLISAAYYKGELVNETEDTEGQPKPDWVHPFIKPEGIQGKAIVWIDTPQAARDRRCEERQPPRYRNEGEVEALKHFLQELQLSRVPEKPLTLAVLSPYTAQVRHIRNQMRGLILPAGVELKRSLHTRRRAADPEADRPLAYTVDSFQGNEADIIAVSLVRNNKLLPGEGGALGFLDEAPRLNVLLSRAERLLVLIGSWDFFCHQVAHVPLEDDNLKLWHWKKALTLLDSWFQSGKALRLSAILREAVP